MVVSYISFCVRLKASVALPITNGARLMLSTPPAIISSASPALMARAAWPTASRPEPHRRLTVMPGHAVGQAGEQQRHARDVAVVLAGLVGAAEDHVVDRGGGHAGVALHQLADRVRGEIVGADLGEAAAVAADRASGCR